MTLALTNSYERQVSRTSSTTDYATIAIALAIVGLIVYLLLKNKPASTYKNAETWDITWSSEGLPTSVTIHRDARTG